MKTTIKFKIGRVSDSFNLLPAFWTIRRFNQTQITFGIFYWAVGVLIRIIEEGETK